MSLERQTPGPEKQSKILLFENPKNQLANVILHDLSSNLGEHNISSNSEVLNLPEGEIDEEKVKVEVQHAADEVEAQHAEIEKIKAELFQTADALGAILQAIGS